MTDDELMKKIAVGNNRAFQLLFDRHSGKVYGYARRLMGDQQRAEDISQEVWMKIVKMAPQYQPTAHFIAWIFTIVRNTSFNHLRNLKNLRDDTSEALLESDFKMDKSSVEEILVKEDDAKKVRQKIEELPSNQRILLTAWMTEDLSYEDLAREMDLSVSAVKSLLFRAKRTLEKSLKDAV